jgi:hypothetical protein
LAEKSEIFDYDQARILALYADGYSIAEIGAEYHRAASWVYAQMAQFPDRKDEAKARRQEIRTGKYRRIAALSQHVQIKTLDKYIELLHQEDALCEEFTGLIELSMVQDWEAILQSYRESCFEAAKEKQPKPSPPPELLEIWRKKYRQREIEAKLDEITHIRSKLKDISIVGAAAEKQADLDDGKPTERVDNQGVQIVTFGKLPITDGAKKDG